MTDSLKLNLRLSEPAANTKRKIWAQTSAVSDPLSLCLPVTIKGRLLLCDFLKQKLGWDDAISKDLWTRRKVLCQELVLLYSFEFPRQVFSDCNPADLYVFCDASNAAYGFAVYVVHGYKSALLFSKAKVASTMAKPLPTLELLSVYLALKCLKNVFEVFCRLDIKNLYVAVDAQIILAWLLSIKASQKNIFVANRLKDISLLKNEILSWMCQWNLNMFQQWEHNLLILLQGDWPRRRGPTWLRDSPVSWPVSE